jgi:hypothetical protein
VRRIALVVAALCTVSIVGILAFTSPAGSQPAPVFSVLLTATETSAPLRLITLAPETTPTQEQVTETPTDTPAPADTPSSTDTPISTSTLFPTDTPSSTDTPMSTSTLFPTDTPLPTDTPQPTDTPRSTNTPEPTGTPVGPYSCSEDTLNCGDFATQAQAQAAFEYCMAKVGKDIHRLDDDNNGIACEHLP